LAYFPGHRSRLDNGVTFLIVVPVTKWFLVDAAKTNIFCITMTFTEGDSG